MLVTSLAAPGIAGADHGPTYRGDYVNAFMAGRTADGRELSILAGAHTDFPYHDPGSGYDQVAIRLDGEEPLVITRRPHLDGLAIELDEDKARFAYSGKGMSLDLTLHAVRHEQRYEGDPAQLGDLFIEQGYEPGDSPGFVLTPYELTGLARGSVTLRGRRVRLAALHGQAEAGQIDVPTDSRFHSRFDYIAAPTAATATAPYTYVGFEARALHSGPEGSLDSYFRDTGSDEFTMEGGSVTDGNPHGAPAPFSNRGRLPAGARKLAQWAVDLGPGMLYRKLIRMRDEHGQVVELLSETIEEDGGDGREEKAPSIAGAQAGKRRISFRLSEPALVSCRTRGRWRVMGDGRAGRNSFPLHTRGRLPLVRATDEAGNRSRAVRAVAP